MRQDVRHKRKDKSQKRRYSEVNVPMGTTLYAEIEKEAQNRGLSILEWLRTTMLSELENVKGGQ